MSNPNRFKFFDEELGMTMNGKCDDCEKPIWHQESVHTIYHGKHYLKNLIAETDDVVGVATLVEKDGKLETGGVCKKCWDLNHTDKKKIRTNDFATRDLRQDMETYEDECKTCERLAAVCFHGQCGICQCKHYCWLD